MRHFPGRRWSFGFGRGLLLSALLVAIGALMVTGGPGDRLVAQPAASAAGASSAAAVAASPDDIVAASEKFDQVCAACHGVGGVGGDRAPGLVNNAKLRAMADAEIGAVIRNGTPAGMPPFAMEDAELARFVALIRSNNQVTTIEATPEQIAAGAAFFFGKGECAACHMVRGRGGSSGPDLSSVADHASIEDMEKMLADPTAMMGSKTTASCPGWAFCPDFQWSIVDVRLKDGSSLRGFARNEAEHSLQLQTLDGRLVSLEAGEYESYVREQQSYMPPLQASDAEKHDLLAYLASLRGQPLGPIAASTMPAPTTQEVAAVLAPRPGEWPSYNGRPDSNRYSGLREIDQDNVDRLRVAWTFAPGGEGLETTPVVLDGVMYVTGAKQVCALDARNGRSFWCTARNARQPLPAGGIAEQQRMARGGPLASGPASVARPSAGVASGNGPNRGVAVVGNRVIFTSDDGYLIAVNRLTGGVMWTVPLTDPEYGGRYYATPAPLVIGDLVVSGVSGGDSATRGFLAAFKVTTGELAWRFWTVPAPGEPAAETWIGTDIITGGGSATWMTGSYDRETDTVIWGVGNPYPSTDGSQRLGDNLYANSVIALDAKTGKLRWHYQFTPHDLHDWDATAPLLLVDTTYQGTPRKLVMQANRNGFFYVLDRSNGKFLFARPFVQKMNWASGISPEGRPILIPGLEPTPEGVFACPAVRGATNWFSTAYDPERHLFFVMAAEDCGVFRSRGRAIYGANVDARSPGQRFLRAINPDTGDIVWEKPLTGSHEANYSGVLATAGGLVFHGETAGGFAAVDSGTGKTLWSLPTNDAWRASPMTYTVKGRQYVAVAAGSNIISFSLPRQ